MAAYRRSEPQLMNVVGEAARSPVTPPASRRSRSTRIAWPIAAAFAGAAASTLVTAGAAAVAGRQADLALQPVELALRVGLLLGAPCVGALLAALVIPSGGGLPAIVGVGVGVPLGPLLVLRLDRMRDFGLIPTLLTVGVLLLWGLLGALLVAGWWGRPDHAVERTRLPPPPLPEPGPGRGSGPDAGGVA